MSVSQPRLPMELEREVFETAFHSQVSPVSMLLIARRVRDWVEPLLYRSLLFLKGTPQEMETTNLFHLQTMRSKPNAFFEANVRLVAVTGTLEKHLSRSFVPELLRRCSNITDLTLYIPDLDPREYGSELIDPILALPLKRLAFDKHTHSRLFLSAMKARNLDFSSLTHLKVHLLEHALIPAEQTCLPNLTHIALIVVLSRITTVKTTVKRSLARSCPELKLFVLVWIKAPSVLGPPLLKIDNPRHVEESAESFEWGGSLSAHGRYLPEFWEHFEVVVDERLASSRA